MGFRFAVKAHKSPQCSSPLVNEISRRALPLSKQRTLTTLGEGQRGLSRRWQCSPRTNDGKPPLANRL
jgi:hypothetical protein